MNTHIAVIEGTLGTGGWNRLRNGCKPSVLVSVALQSTPKTASIQIVNTNGQTLYFDTVNDLPFSNSEVKPQVSA